jgi:hypothetical protein
MSNAAQTPAPMGNEPVGVVEICTPGAIKLARKIALKIMRGPAETCETRQQFLDGAIPIIAAELDYLVEPDLAAAPREAREVADECRAAFDGDDIVRMRITLRKAHDVLAALAKAEGK